MYVITGITGRVGGAAAQELLAAGQRVRAVVRDPGKGHPWRERGCELAVAELSDAQALATAFADAEAVFVLPPPDFDPEPGFPAARARIEAVCAALRQARPRRVVSLSTVGAQAAQENLLSQHTLMEQALAELPMPVSVLRPAWFLDNCEWDIAGASERGVYESYLDPLERAIPMVASADVGQVAARLLREPVSRSRVVELEGPRAVAPRDIAVALARALGRDIFAQTVDRAQWEARFRAQGMRHPEPRMRMLDGFNEGWLDFADAPAQRLRGETDLDAVLRGLLPARP
ncbi:NAD(P)H-binding protein [Lysobacter sp. CA199]|uniref:NAD(P)H-binding protein n=1 Tax=Lysobacter sp. CA199 TaxID=3455608 RepID=UPI003F8CFED8